MKKTTRYPHNIARSKIDKNVDRQRALKEILINVRNGAMISPAIWAIEQLYSGDKNA